MKNRIISIIVILLIILSCLTACHRKNDSERLFLEEGIVVKIGSTEFTAKQYNSLPDGDDPVIYTRNYKQNGVYSVVVGGKQDGRKAVSVRYTVNSSGRDEFDIVYITENFEDAYIPYNGFVLSVPSRALEGVRANVGQIVDVSGYVLLDLEQERTDLATFYPMDKPYTATRRVSMVDPVNGINDGKIYFITPEYKNGANIECTHKTVYLKSSSTYSYTVLSVTDDAVINPGTWDDCLVLTGEYNSAYAEKFITEGAKLMFSSLNKANKYSDMPSLVIGNKSFSFDSGNKNADIQNEGVYYYDKDYSSDVTPATSLKRKDIVYADGIVVYAAENNARTLIPAGNGFVFTFVGDEACKLAESIEVGNDLELYLTNYTKLPNKYAEINGYVFDIDFLDGFRQPESVAVLYTEAFGKTTGTNEYGTEIVIENGKVKSVEIGKGNAEIPKNGYVLSIHKDKYNYADARKIKIGDDVKISLGGNEYTVTSLEVTGVNQLRKEDNLIIYRGKTSTETNAYGFEIAVDANGYAVSGSTEGNMNVPRGGFVVSGHGVAREALIDAYLLGEKVVFDEKNKKVSFIKVPELKMISARAALEDAEKAYNNARDNFANIDYNYIDNEFSVIKPMFDEAMEAYNNYDFVKATAYANSVVNTCNELQYSIIETKGVQNRAVWYRSYEKSDDEVRATVEKMVSLNINALYIETWYDGYCIGNIDVEGVEHQQANGDYDALEGFVRICHENNIEVHAWCENFFAGHLLEDKTYSNNLLPLYKDKILLDSQGNGYWDYENDYGFVFLNPNDRDCRDLVLKVYNELITKYDIDGLHLDYIRFPEFNKGLYDFGYNDDIIKAFAAKTGIKTDPREFKEGSNESKLWKEFRRNIISSFVKEVYDLVRKTRPEVWISAATYPEQNIAREHIFQDAATWCNNGWIDEIFSMTYGADNAFARKNVAVNAAMAKDKCFYSAGLQAFADTDKLDFAWQMAESSQYGADGIALFSLGSINPKTYQYQIQNGSFRVPAVQCDKGFDSFIAQMNYIEEKLANISVISKAFGNGNEASVIEIAKNLTESAAKSKESSDSKSDIIKAYKKLASDSADAVDKIIDIYGAGSDVASIVKDFSDASYWLTLSAARLATR